MPGEDRTTSVTDFASQKSRCQRPSPSLKAHRAEVEAEYQEVLRLAAEARRYWEERNRERVNRIAALPSRTDHPEARARLQQLKAHLGMK